MRAGLSVLAVVWMLVGVRPAVAEDAYYAIPLKDLTLTSGQLPGPSTQPAQLEILPPATTVRMAYVALQGPGEAYVGYDRDSGTPTPATLVVRVPVARDLVGQVFLPEPDAPRMVAVGFTAPASAASPAHRLAFLHAKREYYGWLRVWSSAGLAWFREQSEQATREVGDRSDPLENELAWRLRRVTESSTLDLFSGGRAVAANLQLDRPLPGATTQPSPADQPTVDVATLPGITVQPMDWQAQLKGATPALDPLASAIPADQHAIFFPSFQAAVAVGDELDRGAVVALGRPAPEAHRERLVHFYERQLGLSLTELARQFGPTMVRSLAVAGSDPYFPTGTDVAVIFEPVNAPTLQAFLATQVAAAITRTPGSLPVAGQVGGVVYTGARSPDRTLCAYVATVGPNVVVTNSPAQLGRLADVAAGRTPALAAEDDYRFFRVRYPRGAADESALLVLSDATIRRWCGPAWRIASARRTLAYAALARLQAQHLDRLVKGGLLLDTPLAVKDAPIDLGRVWLAPQGVRSATYGTLSFLTPIAELDVKTVTADEAERYARWRDTYQRNWRWAFDPIALRLGVQPTGLAMDLTVTPLIANSDYRDLIEVTRGVKLAPDAGDPHPALLHGIVALNVGAPLIRNTGGGALRSILPGLRIEPLAWVGSSVAWYVDDSPAWNEVTAELAGSPRPSLVRVLSRVPAALHVGVSNPLQLAVFLTAVRAFSRVTAPNMTVWEPRTHAGRSYVRVGPSDKALADNPEWRDLALYYAPLPRALVISLHEPTLQRAIERYVARHPTSAPASQPDGAPASAPGSVAAAPSGTVPPWLGEHLGLRVESQGLKSLLRLTGWLETATLRAHSFANLPILNEWKRRYPDQDPVVLHERFWHRRLTCPGGGQYVWNETWQTMESTVYGCPAAPKDGPVAPAYVDAYRLWNLGVTFEDQGLRARAELTRPAP